MKMVKCLPEFEYFYCNLENRNFISKIRISKVTDYAALRPPVIFVLTIPRWCFFCGSFLLFMFHVCLYSTVLFVPCSLVVTCWERADLLALLYVMCSCIFVTPESGVVFDYIYINGGATF